MNRPAEFYEKYNETDTGFAICVICHWAQPVDQGETIPEGLVCGVCMKEPVQCYGCAKSYQRKEYVTEKGLDRLCVECMPEAP